MTGKKEIENGRERCGARQQRREGKTGGKGRIEGREKGGKEKKRCKRGDVRTKDEMERMRTRLDKQSVYVH